MSFTVIDHYEGFEKNNFIKRDESQINLLNSVSLSWINIIKIIILFKKKKLECIFMAQ